MSPVLLNILSVFALIMAGLFVLARYLENASAFFPSREIAIDPCELGLPWEDVYFKTKDRLMLNGWFFKHPDAPSALLFAHGNAGNIGDRTEKIKFFYDLGLDVMIFDYRGYGKSEGRPSEKGIYLDAQGAWDYLQSRGDVNMNNVLFYGESLGGAVVIDLALNRKTSLLVADSTFTRAEDMRKIYYPFVPPFFLGLAFNSLDKVRRLNVPKLFIHSPGDEIVPFGVGRKLFDAAAQPKEFLKIHGGHNEASITREPQAATAFIRLLKARVLL